LSFKLGLAYFATDISADVREVAQAVEAAGFESLFVAEHTHIPVSRRSPYPAGGELPMDYARTLDPFVSLMAAASVTTSLKLGTGICLVTERDPIHLAKEVATLDFLSNGRFLFGVGCGWNAEEMADHGTDPGKRWSVTRDRIAAMKALWSSDVASYDGPYTRFEDCWQWPKPTQKPHPPILMGGGSPAAVKHAVEYADGWMPLPDRRLGSMEQRIADINALTDSAGRSRLEVTAYFAKPEKEVMEHYKKIGVDRAVFTLTIGAPPADTLRQIAQLSELV